MHDTLVAASVRTSVKGTYWCAHDAIERPLAALALGHSELMHRGSHRRHLCEPCNPSTMRHPLPLCTSVSLTPRIKLRLVRVVAMGSLIVAVVHSSVLLLEIWMRQLCVHGPVADLRYSKTSYLRDVRVQCTVYSVQLLDSRIMH